MQKQEHAAGSKGYAPVAIVGIGCRFPGGIKSPRAFWDFLAKKSDGTSEVPADRWSIEKYYDPDPKQVGKIYTKRGGFVDGISGFDPQFFGISPREAAYMDPQHRLLLETTWEAFEDAGIAPRAWVGRQVGVFVGLFTHDYENLHMQASELRTYGPHTSTGMSTTIAANRLSHAFDFTGPSMVIDTACSSSLVAVHLACRSLQTGESELAVAGGVNLQLVPEMTVSLCKASMLAPDGRCKSFDARANGYARADGTGMVVLKPLERALADGDAIYAVILGSAVNQDGRTKGMTVPSGAAQQHVMRDALACAGVQPSQITYIEAHGTGTPVGDPIEANALGTVLTSGAPDRAPCAIGSVKSNFGHTESAAGVAGLIKVALMQRHGYIPPNLHFETANPDIPFESLRLRVPVALEEWQAGPDGRRLAGLNSFGFGGTNAHAVIASAPAQPAPSPRSAAGKTQLICLAARSEEALKAVAQQHSAFLRNETHASLESIAAQLACGREHHAFRMTAAGKDEREVADLLDGFVAGQRRPGLSSGETAGARTQDVVFVCSGMGQQWWGMGRGLLESEPVFANKIDELDRLFGQLAVWSLRDILSQPEESSQIDRTEYAQPAIFGLQMGLAALWQSWGIEPDLVVGHSIGEVAAACISGALSLDDAVKVCFHRSRLQASLAGRGGMLAVSLSEADLQRRIRGKEALISIGAVNSPESGTLAGDTAMLEQIAAELQSEGIFARMLKVEVPYHSPVMDEINASLRAALHDIAPRKARIPLISTVTGQQIDGSRLDADYWNQNVRKPVSFAHAMGTLVAMQGRTFIEIGAHPVLASSIGECLTAEGVRATVLTSLRRKQDDGATFLGAVGQLHCMGYEIALEEQFKRPTSRIDLPFYPWQRTTFWTETPESRKVRTGLAAEDARLDHPLLGERASSPQPAWHGEIAPGQPHYLRDHCVQGSVVFPAACFIEMALAAARETLSSSGPVAIERLAIEAPLVLTAGAQNRLQLSIGNEQKFQIHSSLQQEGEQRWVHHVSGFLVEPSPARDAQFLDATVLHDRLPDVLSQEDIYARFERIQLQYGPLFRNLDTAWVGQDEALGRLAALPAIEAEIGKYNIHPAMLDAAFQLLVALPSDSTYLPVGVARVEVFQPGAVPAWAYVRKVSQTKSRIVADISIADEIGRIIVAVSGLACQLFADASTGGQAASGTFLYDRTWVDADLVFRSGQRRAQFLPSPSDLAPLLQDLHNQRSKDFQHDRFLLQAWPAIDALATDYFIDALTKLGWNWQDRRPFTARALSETLGISPRHFRLVERMLLLLGQSGHLKQIDSQWYVLEAPAIRSLEEQWHKLVLAYPACHAELNITRRNGVRLAEFLRDEDEPLSALFLPGSPIAEHMYSDAPTFGPYNRIIADALVEIVRQLPEGETLRILEVGAGTGGLSSQLLALLPAERTDYVYTDVSQSFLNQAKDRFRAYPFVRYEILDAEDDPLAQGFAEGFFDLVVICDAVHATVDLRKTLGNLFTVLAPGGMLALMEMTSPPRWCDLTFGLLPGWWAFADRDLRPDHATLPAARWLSVLAQCGYDACTAVSDEVTEAKGSLHSVILARRPDHVPQPTTEGPAPDAQASAPAPLAPVVLLSDRLGIAETLAGKLRSLGCTVTVTEPFAAALPDQAILAAAGPDLTAPIVVDLRGLADPGAPADPLPSTVGTTACANLQEVVRLLSSRTWTGRCDLWIVTNGTETVGGVTHLALQQAPVRGFARVLKNEHAELSSYLVDLSPVPQEIEVASLAQEILARNAEDEIALRGHRKFLSRVIAHRNRRATNGAATGFRISQEKRPGQDDLVFREVEVTPPGPGQVQVRMQAAGLNFKDFASQAGLVNTASDAVGLEGAGIIVSLGQGVVGFAPGDRVMGLIVGSLSNPVNTDPSFLVRMPSTLSFEDAAGIPVVFLSAYLALKKHARLAEGETVLIHTAASGLGLAELQVARMLGAKVLATAGNDEKRSYLHACGVDYVGDSRSTAFVDEIMQLTNGRGVDVVVNTLPPQMNRHNLQLLRPGVGRVVDLTNIHRGAQLDYVALQKGIQVSGFDLIIVANAYPELMRTMLNDLAALFESGTLRPVPYRRTPIERITETVRSFRKAAHIGKFVVPVADGTVDLVPASGPMPLRSDGSYLVSGGLTGFGLATARWLAEKGARHLVLVGRRGAATPEAAEALSQLRAAGVEVHAVAADVADASQLQAVTRRFGQDWPQLRGIVHAAMVLRDGPILGMTADDIQAVLGPKIDGAWNLHNLTLDQSIDFFLCYSSVAALFGNRDQANYAAANEYLEALCRQRRASGRPALSIGWGAIGTSGYVARDKKIQDIFSRQGVRDLHLDQAWVTISHGLRTSAANLYAANIDWQTLSQFSRTVAASPRFSLLASSQAGQSANKDAQPGFEGGLVRDATPEERYRQLERILLSEVSGVLGIDPQSLDLNRPLQSMGFDSLMAVELILSIERATGYGFSRMSLLRANATTNELIGEVAGALGGMVSESDDVEPAIAEERGEVKVDNLSDREVEALLRELVTEGQGNG
jgi:acyl transferase domain-containing protein/NADPH:quinone reductase-like Zn-dependent oxidoreductase/NAD(P)-dependent dehydrogenase (short-subunit alcohol dehydrogenase family)/SAM-dependent methyltransferase/acyl carrier protein